MLRNSQGLKGNTQNSLNFPCNLIYIHRLKLRHIMSSALIIPYQFINIHMRIAFPKQVYVCVRIASHKHHYVVAISAARIKD